MNYICKDEDGFFSIEEGYYNSYADLLDFYGKEDIVTVDIDENDLYQLGQDEREALFNQHKYTP